MKFRPNSLDEAIYTSVVLQNEYHLPASFDKTDVIIDIGAHIGCFSYACWQRGARNIEGYEPFIESFDLAKENVGTLGVKLYQKAVWRSDKDVSVLFLDTVHYNADGVHVFSHSGIPVEVIKLDDILSKYPIIRLLKVDCEGSEYPILYTSKLLQKVKEICMEVHFPYGLENTLYISEKYPMTLEGMTQFLEKQGFTVTVYEAFKKTLYLISASRS